MTERRPDSEPDVLPDPSSLPSFMVVGAAKAGTTALHHYLRQHPAVFLPDRQEPSFFAFAGQELHFRGPGDTQAADNANAITRLSEYQALYQEAEPDQVSGDVSPAQLYWPGTAERIREYVPEARICVILRNPAERAYSAFMHARREDKEPVPEFAAALREEPRRIADNWGLMWRYADMGHYATQLERYLDVFDRSQVKIIAYDRLVKDPTAVVQELWQFIGVDAHVQPDVRVRHNVSGIPKSRLVHRLTRARGPLRPLAATVMPLVGQQRLRRWQERVRGSNLRRVPAPQGVIRTLSKQFRRDIERTAAISGLDLDHWL